MSPLRRSLIAAAACALMLAAAAPAHADPDGDLSFADTTPVDFGAVSVGSSTTKKVTLENSGTGAADLLSASVVGPGASQYSVDTSACGPVILPFISCDVEVAFNPDQVGPAPATLVIEADGHTPLSTLALSGTGAARQLQLNPAGVDFGIQRAGDCCYAQWIQIQNVGPADVPVDSVSIDGPDWSAFSTGSNNCNVTLAPGNTCFVEVRFEPQDGRSYDATFHAWSGPAEFTASLTGVGGVVDVATTPGDVDFGTVEVGRSKMASVTMTSIGNQPFVAFVDILNGGDIGQFRLMEDGCALQVLAPGDECQLTVAFQPTEAGAFEARIATLGEGDPKITTVRGVGVERAHGHAGPAGAGPAATGPQSPPSADAGPPARVSFSRRGPARYRGGWAYLGRARCSGAPRCRVTVRTQFVVTFGGRARPYLVRGRTRTWTVADGRRVMVPMPRALAGDPERVLLTLAVRAAGRPTGVQYRSVRLVRGRR